MVLVAVSNVSDDKSQKVAMAHRRNAIDVNVCRASKPENVPICARKSVELRAISLNLVMCLKSGSLREFGG